MIKTILMDSALVATWVAALVGILAAFLWYESSRLIHYSPEEAKRDHDLVSYPATVESQSKWNRRAAIATALSLVCQVIALTSSRIAQS